MISLIVAHDKNRVIGLNNKMPWHYPEDLQYFKKTTLNKNVLVGRNTFYSIISYLKKPLPNRVMHVLTSKKEVEFSVNVFNSVEECLNMFSSDEELFVAGGAKVYETFLPYADRLYITLINNEYEGDTYFPYYDISKYKEIKKEVSGDLTFLVLERI